MNIYQHGETGRFFEGYSAPPKYQKIGAHCEKCGARNEIWESSAYCPACRTSYQHRVAANHETRPVGTAGKCKWDIQCGFPGCTHGGCNYFAVEMAEGER